MSLDEKVGQLFVVPICPTHGQEHLDAVYKLLKERHIGGVIFMEGTSDQQREILEHIQPEVFTFQDAEWGVGMRLKDVPSLPKNLTLGAIQDLGLLRAFGRELARQCRSVGIQGDFAPVVDVNSNPKNPVIHRRSFGEDPDEVARRAQAVMEGMQAGGILACAKHFPGHGDTTIDSHVDLPVIDKCELVPFKALIDGGVDMVMLGHLYFPNLSEWPSSMSYEIITGLLREKLGFKGLVITDALNMQALAKNYPFDQIVLMPLLGGADLLLTATSHPEVSSYLINVGIPKAIELIKATVPEEIIDERVERILSVKKRLIPPMPAENKELRRTLYRHALTLIGELPTMGPEIALVQSRPDPDFEHFLSRDAEVKIFSYEEMESASQYPHLIVNVRNGDRPASIPDHAILALFDTPYALHQIGFKSALVGYEDVADAKEALADALFGKLTPLGKLPIRL